MSDQNFQKGVVGSTDHPQHRAPEGQGNAAPPPEETGYAEHSEFDGKGNEYVVVTGANKDGVIAQGWGKDREEAIKDLDRPMDEKNLTRND